MTPLLLALALAQAPATPVAPARPPARAAPGWTRLEVTPTLVRWVHPRLLAEVRVLPAPFSARLAQVLTAQGATVALEKGRVRLWRVADAAALRAALPPDAAAALVPVLSRAPTTAAVTEVPAGGVVLALAPGGDAAALAKARGWALEPLGGGLWRLPAAPGAASLELTRRAAAVPGVRLATPDLWRPGSAK